MLRQMREIVKSGYEKNKYSEKYSRNTVVPSKFEKKMCDELIQRLKDNTKILDLGCGTGFPFDKYFSKKGYKLTGIDISEKQIEKAKKNVKTAKYFVGDFFSEQIKGKFDAIISFYAIFHVPRNEHKKLLDHIHSLLKKEGLILITLGAESMKLYKDNNFAGAPMMWSSYSTHKNRKLILDAGFEIIHEKEDNGTERHLWILAKKK